MRVLGVGKNVLFHGDDFGCQFGRNGGLVVLLGLAGRLPRSLGCRLRLPCGCLLCRLLREHGRHKAAHIDAQHKGHGYAYKKNTLADLADAVGLFSLGGGFRGGCGVGGRGRLRCLGSICGLFWGLFVCHVFLVAWEISLSISLQPEEKRGKPAACAPLRHAPGSARPSTVNNAVYANRSQNHDAQGQIHAAVSH